MGAHPKTKGKSLNFARGSLVGVECKIVHFVVYCVLFVMMSTNIEKNSAVSEEGHVLIAYRIFCGPKLGQYADQELLKSLFQKLKIYIDPSA